MTEWVMGLERVSMVQGPYDLPHMYEISKEFCMTINTSFTSKMAYCVCAM
ncbi:hypothetical protein SAMN04488603_101827 [Paenibacillus sp. cl130]|nr:hypothetical protein SAMN04488603_101827 [Paenibacillus sp. cl130]